MNNNELDVCDACGVTAEIGYMIGEGDEVAEVTIFADDNTRAIEEFKLYLSLAKQVNANVVHNFDVDSDFSCSPLKINFKFECSAEKIIFELRSRSLVKNSSK